MKRLVVRGRESCVMRVERRRGGWCWWKWREPRVVEVVPKDVRAEIAEDKI
jgi:hypothetical protein